MAAQASFPHRVRTLLTHAATAAVLALTASTAPAQNLPPFPDGGMKMGLQEIAVLPRTQSGATTGSRALPTPDRQGSYWTRMNFFKQAPDGRRFVNDERGLLYTLGTTNGAAPSVFLDLKTFEPNTTNSLWNRMQFGTGNAAGFVTFEFHPEFNAVGAAGYGKFYTVHTEVASKAHTAGFNTPYIPKSASGTLAYDNNDLAHHTVLSEWTMSNPAQAPTAANTTRREMLRAGHPATDYFHPFGDVQFRPTAKPGDSDYGLLYVAGGDWGFINGQGAGGADGSTNDPVPGALQRLDTLAGTFIRIDPNPTVRAGRVAGIGNYTVPTDNPYAADNDPNTLGEIWAHGLRNGHRLAWDGANAIVANVGHAKVEEIEIIRPGKNYGWTAREGTFVNGLDTEDGGSGNPDTVGLPATPAMDANEGATYTYPIIQYDHDGARGDQAVAGGFVYRGRKMPELRGKYVFGDMNLGRLYTADFAEMLRVFEQREAGLLPPTTTVQATEFKLLDSAGASKYLGEIVGAFNTGNGQRADLRFGLGADGELYLLTGPDGRVRQLFSPAANLTAAQKQGVLFNGLTTLGGVGAAYAAVTTPGALSGQYVADLDLPGLVREGYLSSTAANAIHFTPAGTLPQFWDLAFTGVGDDLTTTLAYDPALLGAFDETKLGAWQYDPTGNRWLLLPGTVDPAQNRLTFTTDSLEPIILATVPEPTTFGLLTIAAASLTLRRRRR